jgi:Bacterial regulatory helix-turn-helix protein, lysR family
MDRLEGIKIFVRVVESGSFSAVAHELGTGQPAISKQVVLSRLAPSRHRVVVAWDQLP